ncbi:NAD(P)-dependent dehydrogenase (short-subunit alcohol dehydrogenase family) [Actinoplanes lutulentus]|uniref:Short-subunit dehydrogenase n=1 Tax=Actinoplanes lutulentus TaxID=1287878 RepID=A0A327ZFQ9_9ACTN|nr:SDR family NAD(P)-dependent oxidoreductase [Actinoplanes lutulentus]MBB2942423.1 NAD(P)-dependent dehydrogenase (short-subunit alcohol dehydrogenase family) [Actinoplanes lutulentus]RAK33193.1 short-subunit dehydrogenase [Actinoplanes lutulentus]
MAVVIVTGASSGIGRATALRLAGRGWTVVLAARRAAELETLAAEIAASAAGTSGSVPGSVPGSGSGSGESGAGIGAAHVVPTDLAEPDAAANLVKRTLELTGRIDALVNNAGVGGDASVLTGDGEVRTIIEVNLLAPIRLMRAVVPVMREQGSGTIVNIGSVAGEIGIGGAYSASKFGLRGINDSVRRELAGTGIAVSLVEPGFIATELTAHRSGLPGPEIVAEAVERVIKRPRRRVVVPGKYRAAIVLSNAFPFITDRVYAGKAAGKPAGKAAGKPAGKAASKPAGKEAGKAAGKPAGTAEGKPAGT